MERVYVGLGANREDAAARIVWAEGELAARPWVARARRSSLWRTAPVGPVPDQPWFVNAGLELTVHKGRPEPVEMLAELLALEARAGRERAAETPQGPRPLDLDLLLWEGRVVDAPGPPAVKLPHPRLAERAFALAPLVELAGAAVEIPGAGRAGDLLARALADPSQALAKIV